MLTFASLNTIVKDLLYIIRGSKVTQSEVISENQIENWVHQYRSLVLKQDIDKGKLINPDYVQEIPSIKLIKVDKIGRYSNINTGEYTYRTDIEIPKTIDLNFKSGIIFLCTIDGQEIQLVPQSRAEWKRHSKYTSREPFAYKRNGYIFVESSYAISHIMLRGIFEVPTEVYTLLNNTVDMPLYDSNMKYPIPINMIPVIKEMILKKELGIMIAVNSDDKNDSQLKLEPNQHQDV